MPNAVATGVEIRVADEVFIATALLHKENPDRDDFSISEIVARVAMENLFGELRPGVRVHASLHCVANRAPNPARLRMLYATGDHTRRLLRSSDDVHPARTGKIWPDPQSVPPQYRDLIEWARQRYGKDSPRPTRWIDGIFHLRGLGRELWRGEDPDEYVRKLRENWG
jgi:hypothetical protein